MPEHLYGHMVQEYFVERVRALAEKRKQQLSKVGTKKGVLELRAKARRSLARSFGPTPKRTPLNARVTGTIKRKTYTIEKVIYESRPDFPVTANLYIPRGGGRPVPLRPRHVWPFGRGQGRGVLPGLLPGARVEGVHGADL